MIHHLVLRVSDLKRSGAFYDALLAPLGWRRHYDQDDMIGWGIARPVFFVVPADPSAQPGFGVLSVSAAGIAAVKAAWEAGVRAGGQSIIEPGLASGRGSGSYSAFLLDPDGYEVEVTVGSE